MPVVYYIAMDMVPVPVIVAWCPVSIISRVVAPVPRRVVRTVAAYPKDIKYYRPAYIYRFIDIVGAIHVNVTHYLYLHVVIPVALHLDSGYVLESIKAKNRLYYDKVRWTKSYIVS